MCKISKYKCDEVNCIHSLKNIVIGSTQLEMSLWQRTMNAINTKLQFTFLNGFVRAI